MSNLELRYGAASRAEHPCLLQDQIPLHSSPCQQHIGYVCALQLCKGVSAEEAERYRLPTEPMQDFSYLNQSGCSSIEGVDDATDFATLKSAMTAVGINRQQQTEVFEVLAGILWLGNIQFRAPTDDSVSVEPGPAVANAAALLQISERALANALTRLVAPTARSIDRHRCRA